MHIEILRNIAIFLGRAQTNGLNEAQALVIAHHEVIKEIDQIQTQNKNPERSDEQPIDPV